MNIESEVIKNIEYTQEESSKRVVQTILKLSDANVERRLPVQSAKVEIEIPQISDMNLEEVNIDAEKLLFSQGTEDEKVSFSENDYSVEDNKITINVPILKNKEVAIDNFGEDIKYIVIDVMSTYFNNINLVTNSFQAPGFYEKCGFKLEFIRKNEKNPKLTKYFYVKYF